MENGPLKKYLLYKHIWELCLSIANLNCQIVFTSTDLLYVIMCRVLQRFSQWPQESYDPYIHGAQDDEDEDQEYDDVEEASSRAWSGLAVSWGFVIEMFWLRYPLYQSLKTSSIIEVLKVELDQCITEIVISLLHISLLKCTVCTWNASQRCLHNWDAMRGCCILLPSGNLSQFLTSLLRMA